MPTAIKILLPIPWYNSLMTSFMTSPWYICKEDINLSLNSFKEKSLKIYRIGSITV